MIIDNVLKDDKGFIELQDFMGSDLDIVSAARVSYLGDSRGDDSDKKLLFYLMNNEHMSPFETAQIRMVVKCPIFVARQWMRHRSFHYNEVSRRYTSDDIDFYIPNRWRTQSVENKQGSGNYVSDEYNKELSKNLSNICEKSLILYHSMIDGGVSKELARMSLPHNLYTKFVFVADLRNLLHFCRLRSDRHAQWEIQQYSDAILHGVIKNTFPWTYEAFILYNK